MAGPEAPLGEVTMPPVPVVSFDVLGVLHAVDELDIKYEARAVIDDGQNENDNELIYEMKKSKHVCAEESIQEHNKENQI